MEGGPSKPSTSESAPEGAPPKKKRTRTLTTPHQAAVLHALLAQVRPPLPITCLDTRLCSPAVSVSHHPDARGGGEVNRVECSQSPGTPPLTLSTRSEVLTFAVCHQDLVPGKSRFVLCSLSVLTPRV